MKAGRLSAVCLLVQQGNHRHHVQQRPSLLVTPLSRAEVQHTDDPLKRDIHCPVRDWLPYRWIQLRLDVRREGIVVDVGQRHIANERVELLHICGRDGMEA